MSSVSGRAGIPPMPLFILMLGSIIAIGPLSIDLYLPAFPELADSLGTSEPMIQLTLTACLIGLALGQSIVGPLSDALGRRRPLLVGLIGYTVASVLCAIAPTAATLAGARFAQGLLGAGGLVIAQALVRDLFEGRMVARVLSRLILVMGMAPVLAPALGGQLLVLTGWRGLFWVLAAFGLAMSVVVAGFVPETLTVERRRTGGVKDALGSYGRLLRDRRFVAHIGIGGLGFVLVFSYVSGSPFAYQEIHGVSPQLFGALFGLNAVGMVIASQLNARLVFTLEPVRILRAAVPVTAAAALVFLITSATGAFGLAGLMVPLFVVMTSIGFILPNNGAMALNRHPESAGTAAALLGSGQFAVGAFAGPLIGAIDTGTALPMASAMTIGALGMATLAIVLARRSGAAVPVPEDAVA